MRGSANISITVAYNSGTGAIIIPANQVTGAITISGTAVASNYNITLARNGGTGGATSHSVTLNNVPAQITNRPTNPGHTLTGFWTMPSGGTRVFDGNGHALASVTGFTNASRQWTRAAGVELHAQWAQNAPITHTVTNNINNSTPQIMPAATQGQAYTGTITPNTGWVLPATRNDITIRVGGNIITGGTYTRNANGTATITIPANQVTGAITISGTATQTPPPVTTHTVTFNTNQGTPATIPAVTGITPGNPIGIRMPANPTRSNHEFIRWDITTPANGGTFDAGTPVNGDITVTAQWRTAHNPVTCTGCRLNHFGLCPTLVQNITISINSPGISLTEVRAATNDWSRSPHVNFAPVMEDEDEADVNAIIIMDVLPNYLTMGRFDRTGPTTDSHSRYRQTPQR